MLHGFAFVVSQNTFNFSGNKTELQNSVAGIKIIQPDTRVRIYISAPKTQAFIQNWVVGDWVYVGIGSNELSKALKSKLENRDLSTEELKLDDVTDEIKNKPGQYAGVLFNKKIGQLIQITDPFGTRSLFVRESKNYVIVASSLPILRKILSPNLIKQNEKGNLFLLRYAYCLPNQTVYEGINELKPKQLTMENIFIKEKRNYHALKLEDEVVSNNFSLIIDKNNNSNKHEYELLQCLLTACKQQVGDAKKVGVLLGGFDSALVASLLKLLEVDVETYSFHYQDPEYNQPYVNEFSEEFGIPHNWVSINPDVIKDGLDQYGDLCNWPTLWLNYIIQTQYLCKKMVADGVEVCFSGDGCDTAFLGYPSTHRRGGIYRKIPHLNAKTSNIIKTIIDVCNLEYTLGHIARVLLSLIDASRYELNARPLYSFQIFGDKSIKRLMGKSPNYPQTYDYYFQDALKNIKRLSYERKIYYAKSLISPNRCKMVSSSDMSGMTLCSPYLHPLVNNYAQNLPDDVMRPINNKHATEGKYILMKMAEDFSLLPKSVIYQKKMAAIKAPIDEWLADDLYGYALGKLNSLPFKYNTRYVNTLLKAKLAEKTYKKYFSDDGVVSLASSLLITFASFFEKAN